MFGSCCEIAAFVFLSISAPLMPGNGLMTGVVAGTTTMSTTIQPLMQRTEMEIQESGKLVHHLCR